MVMLEKYTLSQRRWMPLKGSSVDLLEPRKGCVNINIGQKKLCKVKQNVGGNPEHTRIVGQFQMV